MTFTPSKQDYANAYANKVRNTKERGIEFNLTERQYISFLMSRHTMKCMYTNRPFVMDKGSNHPDYPELDRVDPNRPYELGNVVFVGRYVHGLKTKYVELERSIKGLSQKDAQIYRTICKTLEMRSVLEERMQPLYEITEKLEMHEAKEAEQREKEQQEKQNQEILDQEERRRAMYKSQHDIAAAYSKFFMMFDRLQITFELTIKEFRDKFRRTTCSVTGVEFDSYEDKWVWVIDLTLPVTASNIVVCKKEASESLDRIRAMGGQDAVMKLINKGEF